MTLPSYINIYGDNFYSNEAFLTDLNTTNLLAVKDTGGISDKSSNINIREELAATNIRNLSRYIEFEEDVQAKVQSDTTAALSSKTANITKSIRFASKEYHLRNSVYYSYCTPEKLYSPLTMNAGIRKLSLSHCLTFLNRYNT